MFRCDSQDAWPYKGRTNDFLISQGGSEDGLKFRLISECSEIIKGRAQCQDLHKVLTYTLFHESCSCAWRSLEHGPACQSTHQWIQAVDNGRCSKIFIELSLIEESLPSRTL